MINKLVIPTLVFIFLLFFSTIVKAQNYVFLFVPDSFEYNAISEVNITNSSNPREVTRHRTVPSGWNGNPSRTAIDHSGNGWIGNRNTNTLIKVGNLGLGTCIDKNRDGVIYTSRDLNNNGVLDDDTIVNFEQDECILMEVPLYYSQRQFVGDSQGVRSVCIDGNDNVYAGMFGLKKLFYVDGRTGSVLKEINLGCSPYGCIVDKNGFVWIACINERTVVKYNPRDESLSNFYQGIYVYGITPTVEADGLVINGWVDSIVRKIGLNGEIIWSVNGPYTGRGITVDKDGNIYAVGTYYGEVRKYNRNGNQLKRVTGICFEPYGIGLDFYENVWVACRGSIVRLDKELNVLNSLSFDGVHYVYSDWTGYLLRVIGPQPTVSKVSYSKQCPIIPGKPAILASIVSILLCHAEIVMIILFILGLIFTIFRR
jgi:hypothetical protein